MTTLFTRFWMKRVRNACSQTGERGFERVARKRVCVLLWSKTTAQANRRDSMDCRHQNSKRGIRLRVAMQQPSVDDALDVGGETPLHLVDETKSLPVLTDWRHRTIEEHQRVVLGMYLAELIKTPETSPDLVDGIDRRLFVAWREEHPKTFLGEGQENVVFAFEIAVDGGGAVLNFFRDLANRNVLISLRYEQFAGSIQNRPRNRLPLPFLTFLDSQRSSFLSKMSR
jgi:hypothetical protein